MCFASIWMTPFSISYRAGLLLAPSFPFIFICECLNLSFILINLFTYFSYWLRHVAWGTLVPWSGIRARSQQWEPGIVTSRPPGSHLYPLLLKDSLAMCRTLGWQFSTWNMSYHCLLVSMVSDEKSAFTITETPSFDKLLLSAFRITLSFDSLVKSWYESLIVELLWCIGACVSSI